MKNEPPVSEKKVRLSRSARSDLEAIARYTILSHGLLRARHYRDGLQSCFAALISHPHLGMSANELAPGLRVLGYRAHCIYYRAGNDEILIVRVLHRSMDHSRGF